MAAATVSLLSDAGGPLLLNIGGSRRSAIMVTVPAGGAVELESDGSSNPASTGWASVLSDSPVAGCALFTSGSAASGAFTAQVGVPDSPATAKATIYGQVQDDIDTAFALNNPASTTQNFKLRLMRSEGTGGSGVVLSEKTLSLGTKRHTAQFLSGTFGEVLDIQRRSFEGWLEIEAESGKTLSALTLRTRGPSLTSLPVAGLVSAADMYTTYPAAASSTTAESKGPVTLTAASRSVALADGTQVTMPYIAGSTAITLSLRRETNTLTTGNSEAATIGSMRVLKVDSVKRAAGAEFNWDEFTPVITIPKREIGNIHPRSVQILRSGPDPQSGARNYLPASTDASGNLVFKDPWLADDLYDDGTAAPGAALNSLTAAAKEIKYTPTTVQEGLNYKRESFLMRMVPDSSVTAKRKSFESLTPAQRAAERIKPVQNVIVLVHGHNEAEKTGIYKAEVERPWYFQYKRDVWTPFYLRYMNSHRDSRGCATIFYEFIYPTYRGIFGDLDNTLASLLAQELAPQLSNNLKFNLFVVSHSMGGLVARAGFQRFDQRLIGNLRRFVSWGSPHLGSSLYSFRLALTAEQYGAKTTLNWFVRRSLKKVIEPSVIVTPGLIDLRWIVPGQGAGPLRLDSFFYQASGGKEYSLNTGSFLFNENLAQLHSGDPFWDKYTFLYGLTSKGLAGFTGATKKDWEDLEAIPTETGKGATLNRWTIFDPGVAYRGAVRGDSDGAVPIESMCGGYLGPGAVRTNLGDVDHEQCYDSNGAQTSTETFNAMDFGNALYACPSIEVASPTAQSAFDDGDTVSVDARLVWPGDAKAGSRIAEVLIRNAVGDKVVPLNARVDESGHFSGTFRAGDLGAGGPAGNGMRVVLVFKDNTELEAVVMTGAILAWKERVHVTAGSGTYSQYAFNTTYDCSCKVKLTGSITRIRDLSGVFSQFQRYWTVSMTLDATPVTVKGIFECTPVGATSGQFDYPNKAIMKWQVDKVTHRIFDGTGRDFLALSPAHEFELKVAADAKNQYLNIEVFQLWGMSVTGPVELSSGGSQTIANIVIDITRKLGDQQACRGPAVFWRIQRHGSRPSRDRKAARSERTRTSACASSWS